MSARSRIQIKVSSQFNLFIHHQHCGTSNPSLTWTSVRTSRLVGAIHTKHCVGLVPGCGRGCPGTTLINSTGQHSLWLSLAGPGPWPHLSIISCTITTPPLSARNHSLSPLLPLSSDAPTSKLFSQQLSSVTWRTCYLFGQLFDYSASSIWVTQELTEYPAYDSIHER